MRQFQDDPNIVSTYICIQSPSEIKIQGTYDENNYKGPELTISRCTGDDCYNNTEITNFIKLNTASMIVYYNTAKYFQNAYQAKGQ